jgi:hypothetical protein
MVHLSRNIESGSNAVWAFQMASGRASFIQAAVYKQNPDGSVVTVDPTHISISESAQVGTYSLSVAAGGMVADGVYFATMQDGDQFVRLQSWTYANSKHFDKVISDIADLDGDVVALSNKLTAVETNLDGDIEAAKVAILDKGNQILNKNDDVQLAIETAISNTQIALKGEIDANEAKIDTLQGDVTAGFAAGAKAADLATLDGKVVDARAEIDGIRVDTEDIQTSLGDLQGLTLGGVAQNDLAGALATLYGEVDGVEEDIAQAVTDINAQTVASQGVVTGAISTSEGVITGAISAQTTQLQGDISTAQGNIAGHIDTLAGPVDGSVADSLYGKLKANADALSVLDGKADSIEGKVDLLETKAQADARQATLEGRFDSVDTAVAGVQTRVDLLETDADAASRHTADQAAHTSTMNRMGAPANGVSISDDISRLQQSFDAAAVTNARLAPFVPSEMISPLQATSLRFTCNVLDGETGALEEPDHNEMGVTVTRTKDGVSTDVTSTLVDGASSPLSMSAGAADHVSNNMALMASTGQTGRFEAFLPLPSYEHGNYEFEFGCYDSDPSLTPTAFSTIRYMVVRKAVQFSFAGAF